jgi:hypothetical protein
MLFDQCIVLGRRTDLLRVRSCIGDYEWQALRRTVQNLVQRSFRVCSFPAPSHEGRVYDDAREPPGSPRFLYSHLAQIKSQSDPGPPVKEQIDSNK